MQRFVFTSFQSCYQRSTKDDPDYIIAVVEFTPELPTVDWQLRTELHFENYSRIVAEAAEVGVDILIFPEYTLNNVAFPFEIPNPVEEVNPCLHPERFDNLLIDLSCLARENEIYLCINLSESEECTEELQQARNDSRSCSSLGITRYNTNVVFDRNGTVIGRYRKFNLFREGGINTTQIAELSTFETDFGVTFGNIICFDVLFFEPAMKLVQRGIKNFIFSAMWTSELPFLNCKFVKGLRTSLKFLFLFSKPNIPQLGVQELCQSFCSRDEFRSCYSHRNWIFHGEVGKCFLRLH